MIDLFIQSKQKNHGGLVELTLFYEKQFLNFCSNSPLSRKFRVVIGTIIKYFNLKKQKSHTTNTFTIYYHNSIIPIILIVLIIDKSNKKKGIKKKEKEKEIKKNKEKRKGIKRNGKNTWMGDVDILEKG